MTTLGDHLKALRDDVDLKDAMGSEMARITARIEDRKRTIMDLLKAADLKSATEGKFTVSVADQWVAVYDPDDWYETAKWLVLNAPQCLYRQISSSKIMELVDNGVTLPEGISVERIKKLNFRRS